MRIIRPITITDEMLTYCSIPENDYPAWGAATAYVTGDRCILAHKIYEASADNTDKSPDTNPDQWIEVSATNRHKVFDEKLLDQAVSSSSVCTYFSGGSDYIQTSVTPPVAGFIEVEFIYRGSPGVLIGSGSTDPNYTYIIISNNYIGYACGPELAVYGPSTLTPGVKYKVRIEWDGSVRSLFLNNSLERSDDQTGLQSPVPLAIGAFYNSSTRTTFYKGEILSVDINGTIFPLMEGGGATVNGYDPDGTVSQGTITAASLETFWGFGENDTTIKYIINPKLFVDSLSLINVDASGFDIKVTTPVDGFVYQYSEDLILTDQIFDLYTFFFEETDTKRKITRLDLPPYLDATITITLTGSGDMGVGEIVLGKQVDLGFDQWNPSIGTESYSSKGTDSFGNFIVVKRPYSETMSCSVFFPPSRFDFVNRRLIQFRDDPVVWVGSVDPVTGDIMFESMVVYGFLKSFDMVIPGPQESGYNIEIIGLT